MGISATTKWILEVINRASAPLRDIQSRAKAANSKVSGLQKSFRRLSAIDYYAIGQSVGILGNQIQQAARPGVQFQDALADVQAITGVAGQALEKLGAKARASAKDFGGAASDSLNTYKVILSRLGPGIAKNQQALDGMERNVRVLSKTMGNDASAAVDALSTAMLQFGVDLSDPAAAQNRMTEMMNVMAAGAKEGAAELPSISAAIKVAGVEASKSKLSFVETNAAFQALAKGGKLGAEAGTALRNVLGKMSGEDVIPKEAAEKLKRYGVDMRIVSDTTLPFTDRLRELAKAQGDATVFAQMFGVENSAAANILIRNIDAQQLLQSKIKGTDTAFEQAKVKMDTFSEHMSRLRARLSDLGITFFSVAKNALPLVQISTAGMQTFANWKVITQGFSSLFRTKWIGNLIRGALATKSLSVANTAGAVASGEMAVSTVAVGEASAASVAPLAAMRMGLIGIGQAIKSIPIIGWVLTLIGVLIPLFKYLWDKCGWFRGALYGIWNVVELVFGKIARYVMSTVLGIWKVIKSAFTGVQQAFKIVSVVFKGIWKVISSAVGSILGFLKKALNAVSGVFKSVFGGVYDFLSGVFEGMYHKIMGVIDAIVGAVKKVWGWLSGFFGKAKEVYDEGMQRGKKEVAQVQRAEVEKPAIETDKPLKSDNLTAVVGKAKKYKPASVNDLLSITRADKPADKTDKALTDDSTTVVGLGRLSLSGGSAAPQSDHRTINQNLQITNHFNVSSKLDIKDIADQVAGLINDRLRDALIAI
ncbi:MAG: phage tail tape measure protein [Flavobacteriales bacterium]